MCNFAPQNPAAPRPSTTPKPKRKGYILCQTSRDHGANQPLRMTMLSPLSSCCQASAPKRKHPKGRHVLNLKLTSPALRVPKSGNTCRRINNKKCERDALSQNVHIKQPPTPHRTRQRSIAIGPRKNNEPKNSPEPLSPENPKYP
jgi:hypothetical protein